jgi:hypothetical protein
MSVDLTTIIKANIDQLINISDEIMPFDTNKVVEHFLCSATIDYCPFDESDELENEYIMTFNIQQDSKEIKAILDLGYWVQGNGFEKIKTISLTDVAAARDYFDSLHDEYELHKDALKIGHEFISKVYELKKTMFHEKAITWLDRQDSLDT